MTVLHGIQGIDVEASRSSRVERRAQSEEFSYAMAAASIEKSAGQSLRAHGAREASPRAEAGKATAEPEVAAQRQAARVEDPAASAQKSSHPPAPNDEIDAAGKSPVAASPTSPSTAPVAQAGAGNPASQPLAAKPAEAAIARAETDAKSKAATLKGAKPAPAPSSAQADFAEILARRLDKQSVFDLRLDPSSMGRVEGRLLIEDSGKAVLALAFDNQASLDFYAGDQEALRLALSNSGLDFAQGDFVFRLREKGETDSTEPPAAHSIALDPQFFTGVSDRAIDIRV